MQASFTRRHFSALLAGTALAVHSNPSRAFADQPSTGPLETFVPCRAITTGPKHHWFGYYDKNQFDPTGKRILSNEVAFEGRSPTGDDKIGVGYVDTANGDSWHALGTSNAWGWQQGCMLQWIGQSQDEVLWNDRQGDRFVARVHSLKTKQTRTIDRPIYTIAPNGKFGLSVDFRRIDNLRPGYGYDGLADPNVANRAPKDSGIWRVDLQTGRSELILSLADVAAIAWPDGSTHPEAWHYFNHLLISPDSSRFIVLHRYRPEFDPQTLQYRGGFVTRMFTVDVDGGNRYVLDPSGYTSHFIWNGNQRVTMWTKPEGQPQAFYDFTDHSREAQRIGEGKMLTNGHNTFLPAPYSDWILCDTYPDRKTRRQTVYLYHVPSKRRFDLGHFPSPPQYSGEWRCDTHPRSSRDGTKITIDSPHADGRQVYWLDIEALLNQHS